MSPASPASETSGLERGLVGEDEPVWPDAAAESAFLADARERGEAIAATPAVGAKAKAKTNEDLPEAAAADASDAKALPPLEQLVERIPVEVREALEDLFRARFVSVKRVPKKALGL